MLLGRHRIDRRVFLAPMAGVTDRPFRLLCRRLGAGMAVSEMTSAAPALRNSRKSRLRRDHRGEPSPRVVQIAGADPHWLAEAARRNVDEGAEVVDINMGCPAKKVCNALAGSALLSDERLVGRLLEAVVSAVDVPVTLKIRTGPSPDRRNAVRIARLAEQAGIQALAVHGRTRACAFGGRAEHQTLRAVREAVSMPLIANGDIQTPAGAAEVLRTTGADAVMIGRAAQGDPWLFGRIQHYLDSGVLLPPPTPAQLRAVLLEHHQALLEFYGTEQGLRITRKHVGWYLRARPGGEDFRRHFNTLDSAVAQRRALSAYFVGAGAEPPAEAAA